MADTPDQPITEVTATAPVRIADVGGWTDTWFAGSGAVCSLGVGPGVTVTASAGQGPSPALPVHLIAPDLGESYWCGPAAATGWYDPEPGRQPLLEHAIAAVCTRFPPQGPITVSVHSAVPSGASLGTSASVVVAVITALETLLGDSGSSATDDPLGEEDRRRIAIAAHHVETAAAGRQAGVQDQWAAAFGGAQLLEIIDYPTTRRHTIALDNAFRSTLSDHIVTIVIGAHDSSAVHAEVIESVTAPGPAGTRRRAVLAELTELAGAASRALSGSDLEGWARVLTQSTEAQQQLHDDLVGPQHRELIAEARAHRAIGWKVNGAGGHGGSLSVVFASAPAARNFAALVATAHPEWTVCGLSLSPGVRVSTVH